DKDVPGYFIVGDGSYSVDLIEIGGEEAEGTLVTATPTADFIPGAEEFVTEYEEQFDLSPVPYSALSYNAINLLADAIDRAESIDSAEIRKAIKDTKAFDAIGQVIEFNETNSLNESNFHVMKVENGEFVLEK